MRTEATPATEEVEHVNAGSGVEPPLYRSRYGGLWTDRSDAYEILEGRRLRGEVTDADTELLAHYIDHGYVILEQATDESVIDEYLAFFEAAWDDPRIGVGSNGTWNRCQWIAGSMTRLRRWDHSISGLTKPGN